MKYVLYTLLAASISMTACRKSESAKPVTQISGESLNGSKATIVNGHNKQSATGLELDYDLVIKEVSKNKYATKLKIHGIKLDGKKVSEYKPDGYSSVVIAINNTKENENVPLAALLKSSEERGGNTFLFPDFEYKGDLNFELVDVSISFTIDGGSVTVSNAVKVNLAGFVINNVKNGGNGTCTFEFTNTGDEPRVSFTNFAILFGNIKGESKCSVEDNGSFFVLPSGQTEIQDPAIAKVHLEKAGNGTFGYLTVTIKGDPARKIGWVTFQPAPIWENDIMGSKVMIDYPVMKFELTHFNQKNGVARFKSTQTWQAVYGKEKYPPVYDDKGWHAENPLGH